jgi:acyl-CoA thioester hydrolase
LPPPPEPPPLADFPSACPTSIRFGDLDRQGHVNNAVFATSFESGRVGLIYDAENGPQVPGATSVVVRLEIDFLRELRWPGTVEIGTAVAEIGRSSYCFAHATFHEGACAATGCTHHGADRSRDPALAAATARADCAAAGPVPPEADRSRRKDKVSVARAPPHRTGASSGSVTAAGRASIGPRRGYESGP